MTGRKSRQGNPAGQPAAGALGRKAIRATESANPRAAGPVWLARAARIRLNKAELARRARRNKHTIINLRSGSERVHHATIAWVREAVQGEELDLLGYLIALHPAQARVLLAALDAPATEGQAA